MIEGEGKLRHIETLTGSFNITRETDEYILLNLRISEPLTYYLHWRIMHTSFNLIDVAIDQAFGRLLYLTVVSYKGELYPISSEQPENVYEGIPMFSRDLWPTRPRNTGSKILEVPYEKSFYTVVEKGRLELGKKQLRVIFFPEKIAYHVRISSDVICEFNDDKELCAILIDNLSPGEIEIIKKSVHSQKQKIYRSPLAKRVSPSSDPTPD